MATKILDLVKPYRERKRDYPALLSKTSYAALLTATLNTRNKHLGDLVRFACLTGLEKFALISLRWDDVNFEEKKIRVALRATKHETGQYFHTVIPEQGWDILKARRKIEVNVNHVFWTEYNGNPEPHKFSDGFVHTGSLRLAVPERWTFQTVRNSFLHLASEYVDSRHLLMLTGRRPQLVKDNVLQVSANTAAASLLELAQKTEGVADEIR